MGVVIVQCWEQGGRVGERGHQRREALLRASCVRKGERERGVKEGGRGGRE